MLCVLSGYCVEKAEYIFMTQPVPVKSMLGRVSIWHWINSRSTYKYICWTIK